MKDIILTINKDTGYVKDITSYLIQQENLQRKIIFRFEEDFVDGIGSLCVKKDDGTIGKIQMTNTGEQYELEIKSSLVSETRYIEFNLRIVQSIEQEETPIFVSKKVRLDVAETIVAENDLPDDYQSWQDTIEGEISDLQDTVENLQDDVLDLDTNKVDKEEGKGLSTNDYTNEEKAKLENLENYDDTEIRQDIAAIKQKNTEQDTSIQNLENSKADTSDIPTELSDLNDDSTHRTVTDTEKSNWNNKSDFSGDYNDLSNKPTIPDVSNFITKDVNNLTYYTLKTSTGSLIDLEINQSTYVVTLSLKDIDGNVISTDTIDLPLESVVVGGSFDSVNKKIVLTLENGNTVDIPVGDLISGLQTEITSQNKLASDLVDDTNSGNKFVTTSEKQTWNAKYDKPSGGIPSTDLAEEYVKNTDYATSNSGGTLKQASSFGFFLDTQGKPYAAYNYSERTYNDRHPGMFVSKDTLEKVIVWKNLETADNKVTSLSSSSTDTQYPSAKCVYDLVGDINSMLDEINGEVI